MTQKIFKGFKQVTSTQFNAAKDAGTLDGYLWFVRTQVLAEGEDGNDVANDEYDIYFGKKQYGHFCEGELAALKLAIEQIRVDLGFNAGEFEFAEGVTTVKGAFDTLVSMIEALTTVTENNATAITANATAISGITEALKDKLEADALVGYVADVEYADNKIIFKNAEGTELANVDATPFIKDGMLSDVEVVTIEEVGEENPYNLVAGEKYIKFVWNTDGGDKEDYILASEIGATYQGSDSIQIGEGNVISLKSADAELVQVDAIPVGGTPLADILTAQNITEISAGNLQAVLEALFSQNLWAENPRRNMPSSLTVSMSAPSITFDLTGIQEVGTTVKVSASAKTATASANVTYSGFTYGYSMDNDNSKDGETPASVGVTGTTKTDSDYALSFTTNNGFGGADIADVAGKSTSDNEVVVAEGTNKITVTAQSPEFTATIPAQDKIYACSSLKKTDDEHVVDASEDTTISGAVKSVTAATSVTGAYVLYVGYTDAEVTDSEGIKGLNAQTAFTSGATQVVLGGGTFPAGKVSNIAMPSAWSLKEVKNGMDLVITDNFAKVATVTYVLPNGDEVNYKVYSNLYGAGVAYNSITIGK